VTTPDELLRDRAGQEILWALDGCARDDRPGDRCSHPERQLGVANIDLGGPQEAAHRVERRRIHLRHVSMTHYRQLSGRAPCGELRQLLDAGRIKPHSLNRGRPSR
jgi:hypothetical protein